MLEEKIGVNEEEEVTIKDAYQYDEVTKEYLGIMPIQKDPNGESWLMPPNVTQIKPPGVVEHQVACYINNVWIVKADYRGKVFYKKTDQSVLEITEIGVEPTDEYTELAPQSSEQIWDGGKWEFPLNWHKSRKKSELTKRWNEEDEKSIVVKDDEFDCDTLSRNRITAAISSMREGGTRQWTLVDGRTITITKLGLQQVIDLWMERCDAYHEKYLELCLEVDYAQSIAEVEAISWDRLLG